MKNISLFLILFFFSTYTLAGSCPDGSDPTRTVSADGSYFIFECNDEKKEASKSSYEEIVETVENTTPRDKCSVTQNAIVTSREFLSQANSFVQLKNYVIDISL